jgi:hypothetical protein
VQLRTSVVESYGWSRSSRGPVGSKLTHGTRMRLDLVLEYCIVA